MTFRAKSRNLAGWWLRRRSRPARCFAPLSMTRLAAALVGLLFLAAGPRAPANAATSPIQRHELPSGLTLLIEERPTSRAVSLALMVRAGSRDDSDAPGLLYFLSRAHMLGTARRPSEGAVQQAIIATGGTLERGTARDTTQYVMNVPADELDTGLDLLADIIRNSLFEEGALEREKNVVGLEINRRLGNPSDVASDLLYATLFEGHPLGQPIVGTADSIRALDRGHLLEARERYYGASNIVLAVAGRVRPEELVAKVTAHFGEMAPGQRNPVPSPIEARLEGTKAAETQAGRQQAIVQLAVLTPPAGHPDRYPLMVLDDVMGLISGRIFTEVRVKRGLAYVAGSGLASYQEAGAWTAYAGTDPQNVDQVIQLLLEEMGKARDEPVPAEEVEGAVSHAVGRQLVGSESNSARAQALARREIMAPAETDESVLESFRRVTAEDVQRVARTYLDPERYVVAVVKP